ncbi:macro domain-containing protein [Oceanotoga sp. DSM 15011]|jgi:putative ATPase|uniref:O-acetyl-ADP-ribose deacetylase (Regulator of RNase III) n=1 Tax=Oceanotoga teriensis TaxID=515440 RepID=A0AA45C776_9BACT|nr:MULTISPECIES: macro domain-containing protein [Oceanotoga]MDN5341401.1 O-acetyl-ADP-ribose deacetylase [Oceanotoga sp.]PWJ95140.1 O-acetyl-ADP-ribose deacetylase (regulator of RNase III) [Oceanotoga teriensis]UYO99132.1 macro domain-containing protein [Oceanotoga sp. DSM 15011]
MNETIKTIKLKNIIIKIIIGDITIEKTDAIVNAANSTLQHGGGVAKIISDKGNLQKESDQYIKEKGKIRTGEVGVTSAGDLPSKYVIHAVGPIWYGGSKDEAEYLYMAIFNSLKRAEELQLNSIAFPAISAGIFGYPIEKAVKQYKKAVDNFDNQNPEHIKEIKWIIYDKKFIDHFLKEF